MQAWLNTKRSEITAKNLVTNPEDRSQLEADWNMINVIKEELRELQSQYNSMAEKLVSRGYVRPL